MPTHTQNVVEIKGAPSSRSLGARDDQSLRSTFPGTPTFELTDAGVRAMYQELALDGVVNDEGHTFGTLNRDYSDAPNMEEVKTGGGGLPASPYVPNPVSPGEGSIDPSDQADPPAGFGQTPSSTPGVGVGALENPKGTSERSARHTLGDYKFGIGIGN